MNIPFIYALCRMPIYPMFLKENLSKKGEIDEHETVTLGEECGDVVPNKLSPKLNDPSSFFIPCLIRNVSIDRTLCDLSSNLSLMPCSIIKKLDIGEVRPTNISLQLAGCSIKYPFLSLIHI